MGNDLYAKPSLDSQIFAVIRKAMPDVQPEAWTALHTAIMEVVNKEMQDKKPVEAAPVAVEPASPTEGM